MLNTKKINHFKNRMLRNYFTGDENNNKILGEELEFFNNISWDIKKGIKNIENLNEIKKEYLTKFVINDKKKERFSDIQDIQGRKFLNILFEDSQLICENSSFDLTPERLTLIRLDTMKLVLKNEIYSKYGKFQKLFIKLFDIEDYIN